MTNLLSAIKSKISGIAGGKTLYYPGCMTAYGLPDLFKNYKAILSDFGINFIVLEELSCCGSPLLNAGFVQDFEEVKLKNLEILRKNSITKIITNCPHCLQAFRKRYGIEAEHITQTLAAQKHKVIFKHKEEVAFHDSCILARQYNLVSEPRALIRQAGFKPIEPARSKEKTFCCGAGGGVKQNYPELANKLAKERLQQLGAKKIVVSCPYCYAHLKENTENKKCILEIGELLVEHQDV
jgi:heterodisulfide reductase subunit D